MKKMEKFRDKAGTSKAAWRFGWSGCMKCIRMKSGYQRVNPSFLFSWNAGILESMLFTLAIAFFLPEPLFYPLTSAAAKADMDEKNREKISHVRKAFKQIIKNYCWWTRNGKTYPWLNGKYLLIFNITSPNCSWVLHLSREAQTWLARRYLTIRF